MRNVTVATLAPNLRVCTTAAGSTATACASNATTVVSTAPAVLLSMGRDWANFTSTDEQENVGTTVGGGPSGRNYPMASDIVFVTRSRSEAAGHRVRRHCDVGLTERALRPARGRRTAAVEPRGAGPFVKV